MPTYKRPGVYVEETLTPLTQTVRDPGGATAAFVGPISRGPAAPTLVSSWSQFVTLFGGIDSNYLGHAVYQYFNNGGRDCYVQRLIRSDAVAATVNILDRTATLTVTNKALTSNVATLTTSGAHGLSVGNVVTVSGVDATFNGTFTVTAVGSTTTFSYAKTAGNVGSTASGGSVNYVGLTLTAKSGGTWGNSVYYEVKDPASGAGGGRFDLVIRYGGSTDAYIVERYPDVSLNPTDSRYAVALINSTTTGSSWVTATSGYPAGWTWVVANTPVATAATALTTGAEGAAAYDYVNGTKLLEPVTEQAVLNVNIPGYTSYTDINSLITWAEGLGTVFLVIDAPAAASTEANTVTAYNAFLTGGGSAYTATSHAAVYGPWLAVDDPSVQVTGAVKLIPPGGAVLGLYSRTDVTRNVAKAPAGIQNPLRGVIDLEMRFSATNQDALNDKGFNLIKPVPGAGFCVMGARTLKFGMPDRYVPIRRTLQMIKKSLVDGTRFAIFEPNDGELWQTLEAVIGQYLTGLMQDGILRGSTPAEAFYVKCDEENNPPAQVAAGTVTVEVGVALRSPAEFIVIRLGQFDGGASTTEINL